MDRMLAMTAFVAVVDRRGFAPAARKLGLSPSAVTRLIAALEEDLRVRLLTRTTRTTALTDAGSRYLERARGILAAVADAEAAARAEHTEPSGRLAITAPTVFGRREVAPLFADFLATHSKVSGELLLADRMTNLAEEGIDLAVRIGHLQDSSLRVRPVGATRRVLVGSPGYFAEKKRPRSPADLARHATILFSSLTPTPEWRFGGRKGPTAVTIRPAFSTNSAEVAIEHARRGFGLTLVLAYQVWSLVEEGALEIVLADREPPPLPIQLVHPSGRFVPAAVRAFIALAAGRRRWDFV